MTKKKKTKKKPKRSGKERQPKDGRSLALLLTQLGLAIPQLLAAAGYGPFSETPEKIVIEVVQVERGYTYEKNPPDALTKPYETLIVCPSRTIQEEVELPSLVAPGHWSMNLRIDDPGSPEAIEFDIETGADAPSRAYVLRESLIKNVFPPNLTASEKRVVDEVVKVQIQPKEKGR